MKYIYLLLLLFVSSIGFSQTNGISYQALILDPTNTELPGDFLFIRYNLILIF